MQCKSTKSLQSLIADYSHDADMCGVKKKGETCIPAVIVFRDR